MRYILIFILSFVGSISFAKSGDFVEFYLESNTSNKYKVKIAVFTSEDSKNEAENLLLKFKVFLTSEARQYSTYYFLKRRDLFFDKFMKNNEGSKLSGVSLFRLKYENGKEDIF